MTMNNRAYIALLRHDPAAREICANALTLAEQTHNEEAEAVSLINLAVADLEEDRPHEARALLEKSVELARHQGHRDLLASCLEALAAVAQSTGQAGNAARLLGAANSARTKIGISLDPLELGLNEQTNARVRAVFEDSAFEAEWRAGAEMDLETAISYAIGGYPRFSEAGPEGARGSIQWP